jgi:hypothetical protein
VPTVRTVASPQAPSHYETGARILRLSQVFKAQAAVVRVASRFASCSTITSQPSPPYAVSGAAIIIQVKANLLADAVVAALVIEADITNKNEDWPTGAYRGAVFLGAAFFAKSSPVRGRLFNFAFDLPLNQGDEPTDILPPFRERIR